MEEPSETAIIVLQTSYCYVVRTLTCFPFHDVGGNFIWFNSQQTWYQRICSHPPFLNPWFATKRRNNTAGPGEESQVHWAPKRSAQEQHRGCIATARDSSGWTRTAAMPEEKSPIWMKLNYNWINRSNLVTFWCRKSISLCRKRTNGLVLFFRHKDLSKGDTYYTYVYICI